MKVVCGNLVYAAFTP
ncbi:hypothetical protein M2G36_21810 [Vibrio vulnificus]|nr:MULTISPECIES: hypothetical protein [Vibrio]MCR9611967.1 hypothetical protein [Vibrio alginolyticus]MCG6272369.1 hypothetical protein [Vibrio vulnificus]MCG6305570.1 hypothetical protein [Vibrio vulnificus]MCG6311843.1 hypothetical protein [Vibrio vulnificus]MCU8129089.1 hypothetical protein [Vibrio vulnificus]